MPKLTTIIRIVAWSLAATIVILSVVPPGLRLDTGTTHHLEHFIVYWTTGLAFGLGYDCKHNLLALLLVVFSGSVEIMQLFVPGRHARLSDFAIDAVAACVGIFTVSLVNRMRACIFKSHECHRAQR